MSGKRPADTSGGTAGGRRQFKQTKLSFFTPASASQPKGAKTKPEQSQEVPAATTEEPSPRATTDSDGQQQPEKAQSRKTTTNITTTTTTIAKTQPPPLTPSTSLTLTLPPSPSPLPNPHTSLPSTATARIHITDRFGDLFAAPPQTLLIHACNALGSWGGGIALAFRARYPAAFAVYRTHCTRSSSGSSPDHRLVGTALLIPPQSQSRDGKERGRGHYVGCLFTSRGYGRARDGPEEILRATGPAMRDLMRLVAEEEEKTGGRVGEVRMCRINSGLFGVPWERSKAVMEEMELGEGEVPGCAEGGVVEVVAYERE